MKVSAILDIIGSFGSISKMLKSILDVLLGSAKVLKEMDRVFGFVFHSNI